MFHIGDKAQLTGLDVNPHLNGRIVTVLSELIPSSKVPYLVHQVDVPHGNFSTSTTGPQYLKPIDGKGSWSDIKDIWIPMGVDA